jgi:hypothetical protein
VHATHPSPIRSELIRAAALVAMATFLVVVALPALLDLAASTAR